MSRIYHFLRRTPIILPVFFDNRTTTISTQNNNTVQGILGTLTNEGVRISFVGKGSVWIIVETEELANRIGKLVFGILPDQIFKTSLISNKNNTTCYLVIISLQGEQLHMPTVQDREQELLKCLKETDAPLTFYSTNPLILFCTNENDSSKLAKILEEKTINLNTVEMYSDINKFIEDIDTSTYQVEEKQKQKNMVEEAPSTTHTNMTQEQQSKLIKLKDIEINRDKETNLRRIINVPETSVGMIIGKDGVNIKKIQQESGARCVVKENTVEISGTVLQIDHADRLINQTVNNSFSVYVHPKIAIVALDANLDQSKHYTVEFLSLSNESRSLNHIQRDIYQIKLKESNHNETISSQKSGVSMMNMKPSVKESRLSLFNREELVEKFMQEIQKAHEELAKTKKQ